jgi:hypothetical protein
MGQCLKHGILNLYNSQYDLLVSYQFFSHQKLFGKLRLRKCYGIRFDCKTVKPRNLFHTENLNRHFHSENENMTAYSLFAVE